MRDNKIVDASEDKSPHERFQELGKKLLTVPKADVDAREKKWQASRKRARKRR